MPIYGYRCQSCGHEFEVLQRFSDTPHKVCPKCQGELRKMVYAAGVVFKGSGFYSTDYKSGGADSEKGSSKESSNGASKSSEGAGEGKAATESKSESTASGTDSSSKKDV